MHSIVRQQQQLFKIVLFSFEAILDTYQLTVIAYPLLPQPAYYLLVGLLCALRLIVVNHNFIQFSLELANGPQKRILLHQRLPSILNVFQFILERKQHLLLGFSMVPLLI